MECPICYVENPKYEIQCGSKIPHKICYSCERETRMRTKPTFKGRILTCPLCRTPEKEAGCRSRSSYEAELAILYKQFYKKLNWCNNDICTSTAKTGRQCSYPNGCEKFICEKCVMCVAHFR